MHYEVKLATMDEITEFSNFADVEKYLVDMIDIMVPTYVEIMWEVPFIDENDFSIERNRQLLSSVKRPLGKYAVVPPSYLKKVKATVSAYIILQLGRDWPPEETYFATVTKIYDKDETNYKSTW